MTKITLQLEPMWGFRFDQIAEIATALEAHDWDGLSVSDHIFWNREGVDRNCFEAWTLLAALAPITSTLRLSTLVTANSYRQPSLLAKMAAGIDNISGGRVDFGIGAGWKQDEYEAYGYPFPGIGTRQAQMSEAIDLTRLMWTEGTANFDGKHYQLVDAVSAPKPVQSTIPIWIGGHGDNLLKIVAAKADGWNMVFGRSLDELRDRHAALDQACADIDRDPADVDRSVFLFTAVVDNDREIDAITAELDLQLDGAGARFVETGKRSGLIGPADQVIEALQAHLATGFGGLHLLFPFGHEIELIERYRAEVLPHLD